MKPFSNKDPDERVVLGFNFSKLLDVAETVVGAQWKVEDADGVDAPQVASGSPDISAAPIVKQLVIAGAVGETYMHRAIATTSAGRTLVLGNIQRIVKGGYSE